MSVSAVRGVWIVILLVILPMQVLADCCNNLCAARLNRSSMLIHFPSNADFNALNTARWSKTAILSPGCIFRPYTVEDVSKAVASLSAGNCSFAIKSGGHMFVPGANNINGGVSIDLGKLDGVRVATDRSTVSVGPGAEWLKVYQALDGKGLMVPGGLCGTTGVGGLTLGGGQSIFSPKVGWVADNVINFQVVLASGKIINANQTANSDLFKALKGGGSNFGLVTRIDLAAFPHSGTLWGGQIIVPASVPAVRKAALEATTRFTAANNHEVDRAIQTAFFYFSNGTQVIDLAVAATDGAENPESLSGFTGITPQVKNSVRNQSFVAFTQEILPTQPAGYRDLWASVTFVNDNKTMFEVQQLTDEIYAQVRAEVPGMDWIVIYSPQPKIWQSHSTARGGNVLGLEDIDHDQVVMELVPRWQNPVHDSIMYAAAAKWTAAMQERTQRLGTADPFVYLNFASQGQKPLCSYGKKNFALMQRVAAKYDPQAVFQTLVPGGFKLSQAC